MNRELEQRWQRQQDRVEDWQAEAAQMPRQSESVRPWAFLLKFGPFVIGRLRSNCALQDVMSPPAPSARPH
jgi:hypothetical protein